MSRHPKRSTDLFNLQWLYTLSTTDYVKQNEVELRTTSLYHRIVGGIDPQQGQVMLQHFTLAHKK